MANSNSRLRWLVALFVLSAASVLSLYAAPRAHAQRGRVHATDINAAFEFKMGPWSPSIDSGEDLGDPGPWEEIFGQRTRLLYELEYDQQFYRGIGSLGVGLNLGYSGIKAGSLTEDGERGADSTRFTVVPIRVAAVYRFDWLSEELNIPLVPTLKLGLDYYLWWVGGGDGAAVAETDSGSLLTGRGGTAGVHAAFGLYLLLDWFAPQMAQNFDVNTGVNHSYLFAEYMLTKVNDFGSSSSWDLSHRGFTFGIAFEF